MNSPQLGLAKPSCPRETQKRLPAQLQAPACRKHPSHEATSMLKPQQETEGRKQWQRGATHVIPRGLSTFACGCSVVFITRNGFKSEQKLSQVREGV